MQAEMPGRLQECGDSSRRLSVEQMEGPRQAPRRVSARQARGPRHRRSSHWYTGTYEAPMKKYGKFAALIVVILGTLLWLATVGSGESKSYYKTIAEVRQMGADSAKKRLR